MHENLTPKTLKEFYIEFRKPNSLDIVRPFSELTDQMVWDAALESQKCKHEFYHTCEDEIHCNLCGETYKCEAD